MDARVTGSLALIVCLMSVGCRQNPYANSQLEAMRAERLQIEDDLYALEADYRDAVGRLDTAIAENNDLRVRLGMAPREVDGPNRTRIARPLERQIDRDPRIDLGTPAATNPIRPDRASVQPPPRHFDSAPIGAIYLDDVPQPEARLVSGSSLPPLRPIPQSHDELALAESMPIEESMEFHETMAIDMEPEYVEEEYDEILIPEDTRVTHIVLHPTMTTGHDFDHKPGDDGIALLLQPRNADDQFVPFGGQLSVVVIDPEQEGEKQRVASWEVDIDEVDERLEPSMRGFLFRMPWPDGRPKNNNLQLFVRYMNEQGEKLESDMELAIDLPGMIHQRWTPKASKVRVAKIGAGSASKGPTDGETLAMSKPLNAALEIAPTAVVPKQEVPRKVAKTSYQEEEQVARRTTRPSWRPTR